MCRDHSMSTQSFIKCFHDRVWLSWSRQGKLDSNFFKITSWYWLAPCWHDPFPNTHSLAHFLIVRMSASNNPPPVKFVYRDTPLNWFYRAVTARSHLPDHGERNCHVLTHNGNIFYSPNCTRDVNLPSHVPTPLVRNAAQSDISEFHNPLWWNERTAYLAFLSLEPIYDTASFDHLAVISWVPTTRCGYGLKAEMHISWCRLKLELLCLTDTLLVKYGIPPMEKIIDHPMGFPIHHRQASGFQRQANWVRAWFSRWMGLISFCIAISLELEKEDYRTVHHPGWFKLLERCWYEHNLLSNVQMTLGTFAPHIERAGIFLQVVNPYHHQYAVEFFMKYNIPVWYPLETQEIQATLAAIIQSRAVSRYAEVSCRDPCY